MPATSSLWLKLLSQTFKAFHNLTPSRFPHCSLDLNSFNLHNFSSPFSSVECIPHPLLCAQECPGDQVQVLEHCVSVPPLSHSPSPTQCVTLDDADSPLSLPTLHHNPSPFRASPRSLLKPSLSAPCQPGIAATGRPQCPAPMAPSSSCSDDVGMSAWLTALRSLRYRVILHLSALSLAHSRCSINTKLLT